MTRTIIQKQGIRKIIQTLNKWSKKPTLDQDLSGILDEYRSYVHDDDVNFAETAIIIQYITHLYDKRIDLLFDNFYSLSIRLCSALRRPEEENQSNTPAIAEHEEQNIVEVQQNIVESPTQSQDKQSKKEQKTPEKPKRGRKRKIEQVGDTPKKFSIPGLPDEFLESLNITNCNIDEVVRECLSKLTPTHPLYSVFAQIGDKISRTRNVITYNNVSLTGNCWNVLYILENLLAKNKPEIGESSGVQENSGNLTETSSVIDTTQTSESNVSNAAGSAENNSSSEIIQNTLTCTQISENGVENINEMYEDNNNESISHINSDSLVNEDISSTNNTDSVNTSEIRETTASDTEISSNITESSHVESSSNESSDVEAKNNNTEIQVKTNSENMETSQVTSTEHKFSEIEIRKTINGNCKVQLKEIKINLLRLPDNVLLKVDYFRLSSEYFNNNKKKKAEQKIKNLLKTPEFLTRKRKAELEAECRRLTKRLRSYDLNTFEEFCYSYNCSQGIQSPIPEKITIPPEKVTVLPEKVSPNRKSIDNHSVVSYGSPVTPADSGHFSSFHTDSDFADTDSDHRRTSSRADSGVYLMSPPHETSIESALPFSSEPVPFSSEPVAFSSEPVPPIEDPMFSSLKEMFPNAFADPQRFEMLKSIVRPPEKQGESENYLEWKKFIEDKSSKDVEFNIHEYGSEILNCFPTKTQNEVIRFQTVVCHKSEAEVSRFFVSMLQLANTYNIEICEERQGEINADGVKLKFLSDERPHEEFEELNLPSESQFFASLESSYNNQSTPSTSRAERRSRTFCKNPAKKRRIN